MVPSIDPHAQPLKPEELRRALLDSEGWSISTVDEMNRLNKTFEFANFAEALAFTNRIGQLAEEADHHPQITLSWGRVEVAWWSHSAGGVTANDIEMSTLTNALIKFP